jgi:Asp-tRNA(Asn)/Glu-tRNA(Gln) amidotransferase C subunit
LDAWAKSGGGRKSAERAEEILEWMDRLYRSGNQDVRPDTITFNAVLDAWARSGDRMAAHRAEQILDHMDELYRAGNHGVKPDTYTYNTLINAHAKSSEKGSAARAEHVLQVMKQRYLDGDNDFKPNTRTHTSVIDAWAKSGEKGAAKRAEQILNNMISSFEANGDVDIKPNVHTANAVCNVSDTGMKMIFDKAKLARIFSHSRNVLFHFHCSAGAPMLQACAFTKLDEDRPEALQIAFRVFDWLAGQTDMEPDAYTYTILLSVCSNLLPREDRASRYSHAKAFFDKCCENGHVNDYVLRKLRQTVSEQEYFALVEYRGTASSASNLPTSWTRKVGNKNRRIASSSATAASTGGRSKGSGVGWSSHSRRPGGNKY